MQSVVNEHEKVLQNLACEHQIALEEQQKASTKEVEDREQTIQLFKQKVEAL